MVTIQRENKTKNVKSGDAFRLLPKLLILTLEEGWKDAKDITTDDIVYALNKSRDRLYNTRVKSVVIEDYIGILESLSCNGKERYRQVKGGKILHRIGGMYKKTRLKTKVKDYIDVPTTAKSMRKPKNYFPVSENLILDSAKFFYFLGLYIGDGYYKYNGEGRKNYLAFHVKKEEKIDIIRESLEDNGFDYAEKKEKSGNTRFYIYGEDLVNYFMLLGRTREKHIPREVFDYSPEELSYLYRGLIDTDGHVTKEGGETFYTSSNRLLKDFQELCILLGKKTVNTRFKNKSVNGSSYMSRVYSDGEMMRFNLKRGKKGYSVKRGRYEGDVVDIETADGDTILASYNGNQFWVTK